MLHSSSPQGADVTHLCAICEHLDLPPRATTSLVSIEANGLLGSTAGEGAPNSIPVCPEHAVDVYRGRVPGVAMAWRVLPTPAAR